MEQVESMMKIESFLSDYSDIENIIDVPENFLTATNPLYIAAREGQAVRVRKLLEKHDKKGMVVTIWQLGELGYLTNKGLINKSLFKLHGYICSAAPSRVHEVYRKTYEKFLWQLRTI